MCFAFNNQNICSFSTNVEPNPLYLVVNMGSFYACPFAPDFVEKDVRCKSRATCSS